ncbi:MAG: glycosyltransferase family 4 protein [Verrucomicrobia bacterium]|nr:glycosyltransferase family 4 protein [Verrucomicrobiota bacterium]
MKLALTIPRYDPASAGGAEVLAKDLLEHLAGAGHTIEVLTTCARNHATWANEFEPGVTGVNGITVRRFHVNEHRDIAKLVEIQERILAFEELSHDEEKRWIANGVNSEALYRHLQAVRSEFDAFLFIPYLFGTTYWGAQIVSERSVLIPCLHDEPYAALSIFRELFDNVKGVLFNTEPERDLGIRMFDLPDYKTSVVGMGFEPAAEYDGERFRRAHRIKEPFILYSGRREHGKNTPLLLEYFRTYKRYAKNDLRLVLLGSGPVELQPIDRKYVTDLGYVSEQTKHDACAAALAFVQPSVNESLSIVIMESWLAGRPVVVHAGCAVTRDHAHRSQGGLAFGTYFEFEEILNLLLERPDAADALARNGRAYVRNELSWSKCLERFETAMRRFGLVGAPSNGAR